MDRLAALLRRAVADPRTDGQLLAAFLAEREEVAFAELVRRHGPLVWGVCRRAFANRTDAEDAFQATFLVLVRRAQSLTASPAIGPWLFKVASWTVRGQRRKAARFPALDLPPTLSAPPSELPPDFDAVLLGLPERCRAALLLCHAEGLTHGEAAKRLGCPEGTVSSLVSRGLAKLRTKFAGRDPSTVLTLLGVTVPVAVADAALRSATVFQLASPTVLALTHGVLRMFWIKKATATALAAVLLVTAGVGIGVSVQQSPHAVAQDKQPAAKKAELGKVPEAEIKAARDLLEKHKLGVQLSQIDIFNLEKQLAAARQAKQTADEAVRAQETAPARLEAKTKKDVAAAGPAGPRVVLTVYGADAVGPFVLTEYDATGKVIGSTIPGVDLTTWPKTTGFLLSSTVFAPIEAGLLHALTQLRGRAKVPELHVVFKNDVPPAGGYPLIGVETAGKAGYETIRFTGYRPLGGFIPQLKPEPDGEAPGYKRYKGEVVRTKKLLDEYSEALRRL